MGFGESNAPAYVLDLLGERLRHASADEFGDVDVVAVPTLISLTYPTIEDLLLLGFVIELDHRPEGAGLLFANPLGIRELGIGFAGEEGIFGWWAKKEGT